jgi:hypothetical protein
MKIKSYILAAAIGVLLASCQKTSIPSDFSETSRSAKIYPEYEGVVIPPNIAPMNFIIYENAEKYAVSASYADKTIEAYASEDGKIMFDENEWKTLLSAAKGKSIQFAIYAKTSGGEWTKFKNFSMDVAEEEIDNYVSYRLIEPGYETYRQLGLYQRNLTNFKVQTIYENNRSYEDKNNHCINCHNYQNYSTRNMLFHIRGAHGGTMIVNDNNPEKINMKSDSIVSGAVYPSWHPTKPWIVFSSNNTGQTFHLLDKQKIEVIDIASDLIFYDTKRKTLRNILRTFTDFETFPAWSPDGQTLYYCKASLPELARVPDSLKTKFLTTYYKYLHYDIMSMSFDASTQTFGKPQLVVDCASRNKSAAVPRISPDGKYLLFTVADYGQFHIWHKTADLYIKDLQTGQIRNLKAANSNNTESYHSWSSNGRWIMFTSRRNDGSYTRLYISYFDRNGKEHKAFMIPQRDPEQNILLLKSYNVPEMTRDAVKISSEEFRKVIYDTEGTPVKYESSSQTNK